MTRTMTVHNMMLAAIGAAVLTSAGVAAAAGKRPINANVEQGRNSAAPVDKTMLEAASTKTEAQLTAAHRQSNTKVRLPVSEDGGTEDNPIELTITITASDDDKDGTADKFAVRIDVEDDADPEPDYSDSESDANADVNGAELWKHLQHVIDHALTYMAGKKE